LKGGGDHRLSPEEQKGLIGELLVIERHLLPLLSCADAIGAWRGPLGSPKDFEIGHTCVEVKARRGAATPHVAISSESQLDNDDVGALFLYVVDVDKSPSNSTGCFSLTDVASRVRDAIVDLDQGVIETFEGLLAAAGFRWADDYTDALWIEGAHRIYRVADAFPRITASQMHSGVTDVRYSISLVDCQPYLVGTAELDSSIKGDTNGI
jgi:hypothetical protein